MSDESELHRAAERASRAQSLVNDELLKEAFKALEDSYMAAWRGTTVEDVQAREKLFLAVNVIGKVQEHLNVIVANGELAKAEIQQFLEAAERKKRWGLR